MKIVYGDSENVALWVGRRIPFVGEQGFGNCVAVGILSNAGAPMAGIVWHDYQPQFRTIAFSIASDDPRWIRKNNIRELLKYPFEVAKVMKVWTATPSSNERALRLAKGLGFIREGILSHHFGKDHAIISRMFLSEYNRQYGVHHGKAYTSGPARSGKDIAGANR